MSLIYWSFAVNGGAGAEGSRGSICIQPIFWLNSL